MSLINLSDAYFLILILQAQGSSTVLRVDNESGEVPTQPTQEFPFVGYEFYLDLALVNPLRWMAQFSGFDPTQSNMFLTSGYLMSLIGLLASTEKMVPEGRLHMKPFSVSPQGALEISSVVGKLSSLVRDHFSSPRMVAKSCKRDEGCRPLSQSHSIQLFTDASNEGWGSHLELVSIRVCGHTGKRLHINILELKAVFLALERFKDHCQTKPCWLLRTTQQ